MTAGYLIVPIYEAKVSRDMRIVYQIDLDTDLEFKVESWVSSNSLFMLTRILSRSIDKVR